MGTSSKEVIGRFMATDEPMVLTPDAFTVVLSAVG